MHTLWQVFEIATHILKKTDIIIDVVDFLKNKVACIPCLLRALFQIMIISLLNISIIEIIYVVQIPVH